MRILAISDTHGIIETACDVINSHKDVDVIVHLGDHQRDAAYITDITGREIISVAGNCDGAYGSDEYRILETEIGDIYLTHGHMEQVKGGLLQLSYKVMEKGCVAAIYGHTHIPCFIKEDVYYINPGSMGKPIGKRKPSYAMIEVGEFGIECEIVFCDVKSQKKDAKNPEGAISKYLNFSDRF